MTKFPAEPILFKSLFKEKIWGGKDLLEKLAKAVPKDALIGECWEVSAFDDNQTYIVNGIFKGKPLGEIYSEFKQEITGNSNFEIFPLLLKFIDSKEKLSVQVHPDDEQVLKYGTDRFGKTECWYIIDAQKDSELIIGFKQDVTDQDIKNSLNNGNLLSLLNTVKVYPGQVYLIPSGTVHAIMGKTLLYEIQQTSDTTFRLYDWDRKDKAGSSRQLHVKEALEVSDKKFYPSYLVDPLVVSCKGYEHLYRAVCRYFSVEQYKFHDETVMVLPPKSSFQILTVLKGRLKLYYSTGTLELTRGQTTLIPFILRNVKIISSVDTDIIICTTPDIPDEIIAPLSDNGFDISEIQRLGGFTKKNDLCKYN